MFTAMFTGNIETRVYIKKPSRLQTAAFVGRVAGVLSVLSLSIRLRRLLLAAAAF